jgi:hypothetical protein
MRNIEVLAAVAISANAVVYGTDVFGAIVLHPAIAAVDDRALTQPLGATSTGSRIDASR